MTSSVTVCGCQAETTTSFDPLGGSFTKSEICDGIPGVICIYCGCCVAVKIEGEFQRIEDLLVDPNVQADGWRLARCQSDYLKHKLLNFGIYRFNEPPNKDNYECNYSDPLDDVDQVYLLWVKSKASGFVTLRECPVSVDKQDIGHIVDTVFLRQSARSQGHVSNFVKGQLATDSDLGFSQPISNNMIKSLLKLAKKTPEFRERIWLVDQDSDERQVLWWSAAKLARQRHLDLKTMLK